MKLIFLSYLLVICSLLAVQGQNKFPTTGAVGIGTANPTSLLHVFDNNRNYYVDRAITGQTEDAQGINYLLLHEIYTNTLSVDRYVMGKISGIRGGVGGSNRKWTVEVNTATAYNSNRGSLISYNEPSKLITLVFNGKSYLALEIANSSTLNNFSFTGYAGNELLQLVTDSQVTNVQAFTSTDPISIQSNVSIGGTYPAARLDITGGPLWTTNSWVKSLKIPNGSAFEFTGAGKSFGQGASNNLFYFFHANTDGTGAANYYMAVDGSTGNVAIGSPTPAANYKLVVEGAFGAKKIKVQQGTWADYVFHENYQLPSLSTVEQFIKENKHLEGIPSEAEVSKDGIDVGDMNKRLLQKIEELTLYIIDLNKKVAALQALNPENYR
ncbi:hypothetical protein [Chitinophaga nivalis]|uniref:Tail fiber domain-containing protein n=1 Tax=Chitinophaga nivalis TaxID=2991709 RepID=A0ABT3IM44_9BACT|nr:hypothetical protein [Chitinophaga nivalis]MCW3465271.1 hypothetical protein [Chitinophaga nivalis]MCW3485037.1 hypothetical protein [Chitinophaga nivalis]